MLIAIAFAGSSCSMIDQFNPFGTEKYKMEITPDTPASRPRSGSAETGKWRAGMRQRSSPILASRIQARIGPRRANDDDLCELSGGRLYRCRDLRQGYCRGLAELAQRPLCFNLQANTYYMQIPDISRDQENAQKALTACPAVV